MRTLGNILWVVLAGIWLAIGYAVSGVVLCITIVGLTVVRSAEGGCLELGANVVWLVLFGWEIFLVHLLSGLLLCITIIGIPFGIQAFKLSTLALWPFGRTILTVHEAEAMGHPVLIAVPADPRAG